MQAAASKDKSLLERAWAARDLVKIVDLALGWPLYFAKKFAATVRFLSWVLEGAETLPALTRAET